MIANLRNYEPETIEFVVPDSIREKFPPVLFQGSTNVDELIKLVNEHFNATFPESEVTQRLLDEFEISEIREEYCIKQENEVPKRERELLEAIERAKKIKSDAQDRLASIKTEIKDLAAEVKKGTREYHLSSKNTIRFALDGYFLYYSWVNGEFKLVKAEKIPDWEEAKRKVRIRDGHKCQMCGKDFNLEIHHKTYRVNGKSIVGHELEHLDCLVTLCGDCHSKVHKYHIKL